MPWIKDPEPEYKWECGRCDYETTAIPTMERPWGLTKCPSCGDGLLQRYRWEPDHPDQDD